MAGSSKKLHSSFHGNIGEIPDIAVDNFENKSRIAYFLSHVHSDHTVGLFRKYPKNKKIYMSNQSKVILRKRYPQYWNLIKSSVEGLSLARHDIQLGNINISVTLIPVTHMPGAVMFLFKTGDNTILYTGDFVLDGKLTKALKAELKTSNGDLLELDAMYLDSTFDSEDYEAFPPHKECLKEIVDKIKVWLENNSGKVYILTFYDFGYEAIYKAINKKLNVNIYTEKKLFGVFKALLKKRNPMSTYAKNSRIFAVNAIGFKPPKGNILQIELSALCGYQAGQKALTSQENCKYQLCYSTHCSQSQLEEFKRTFPHKKLVRFPDPKKAGPLQCKRSPYKRSPAHHVQQTSQKPNVSNTEIEGVESSLRKLQIE